MVPFKMVHISVLFSTKKICQVQLEETAHRLGSRVVETFSPQGTLKINFVPNHINIAKCVKFNKGRNVIEIDHWTIIMYYCLII